MKLNQHIFFLGIAEFIQQQNQAYPFGNIDLFQLSKYKVHIIYPAITKNHYCLFLIRSEILKTKEFESLEINIIDENGKIVGNGKFESIGIKNLDYAPPSDKKIVYVKYDARNFLVHFKLNSNIERPGEYKVVAKIKDKEESIDIINFLYSQAVPLSPEEILAIESNPNSAKSIIVQLGCKYCDKKLNVYSSIKRMPDLEADNCKYQYDIKGNFICDCGKTNYDLKYLRESLHGMLRKNITKDYIGVSYIRMYAHNQIIKIANEFNEFLLSENREEVYQKYIEKNPVLLAKYHAKNIFVKPNILGKFEPDFVILDSSNHLKLIELEKPSIKLFRQNKQPRQELMHAFGQVVDWLDEYKKNPDSFLECLELTRDQIATVRGVVIAGNSKNEDFKNLQRYYSRPIYPEIDLMTIDELSTSLLEISKKLI